VRDGLISGQVLALVNAFVLAKVMFIAAVIILFIVLIPFFAFQELGRTIGSEVLRDIFFKSSRNTPGPSAASPMSSVEVGPL
jgi:hypothetical protein